MKDLMRAEPDYSNIEHWLNQHMQRHYPMPGIHVSPDHTSVSLDPLPPRCNCPVPGLTDFNRQYAHAISYCTLTKDHEGPHENFYTLRQWING